MLSTSGIAQKRSSPGGEKKILVTRKKISLDEKEKSNEESKMGKTASRTTNLSIYRKFSEKPYGTSQINSK